jgi:hypothetical protein
MRMFQRLQRRAKSRNRNYRNRNRPNHNRKRGADKSRIPLNRKRWSGMRIVVEDAGEVEVVAAEAVVARRQVFPPDKLKQPLL